MTNAPIQTIGPRHLRVTANALRMRLHRVLLATCGLGSMAAAGATSLGQILPPGDEHWEGAPAVQAAPHTIVELELRAAADFVEGIALPRVSLRPTSAAAQDTVLPLGGAAEAAVSEAEATEATDMALALAFAHAKAAAGAEVAQDAAVPAATAASALAAALGPDVRLYSSAASRVPASAPAWFFVDPSGVLHYASTRLDARYQRFSMKALQAGDSAWPSAQSAAVAATASAAVPRASKTPVSVVVRTPPHQVHSSRGYQLHGKHIYAAARQHGVDADLLKAIATAESGFNAAAISPKGAIGLMQVIPDTAARFGVAADKQRSIAQKLQDPAINVPVSARYVRYLQGMFPGRPDLVLAAYNAGEGAVKRYGNKVPPYKETQNYVKTVMTLYASLQSTLVADSGVSLYGGTAALTRSPLDDSRFRMTIPASADVQN